jgi:hypothetical protein
LRVDNKTGIKNLCEVAIHVKNSLPINSATKFVIRTVLREAINKSRKNYKGNINRNNCSYISKNAKQFLSNDPGVKLIADHMIPVSLALREFESLEFLTIEAVVNLVSKYSNMALITKEEDNKLRELGLVKKMPQDWDSEDIFARYDVAKITIITNT